MNKIGNPFPSIEQITDQYFSQGRQTTAAKKTEAAFEEILKKKQSQMDTGELKFSKHASMRLLDRNIQLSQEQRNRLQDGAQKAEEKGIKESLVLMDSLAFIVNIPNRTVVTAMEQGESSEHIYTNIDGAVII